MKPNPVLEKLKQGSAKYLEQPLCIGDLNYSNEKDYQKRKEMYSKLNLNNKRVIEIGCNFGMNLFILSDLFRDAELVGIDKEKKCIEMAQVISDYYQDLENNSNNIKFKVENYKKFDYSGFDWVLISYVAPSLFALLKILFFMKLKKFKGGIILRYPNPRNTEEGAFNKKMTDKTLKLFKNAYLIDQLIIIKS